MESIKKYIIAAVVVLSLVVIFVIVKNVMGSSDTSDSFINSTNGGEGLFNTPANKSGNAGGVTNGMSTDGQSVTISNHSFGPAKITVKKGTTVTWINQDNVSHDITPDNPTSSFKQSSLLGKGQGYSVTFNEVGTFNYFCTPHSYMRGSVEVVN